MRRSLSRDRPRARPRAKSGQNFEIGRVILLYFFAPNGARVVCFLPRAPIGFRAGQKNENPIIKPDH